MMGVSGLDVASAEATAVLLLAASEGAVVISRAERDIRPFEAVAAELLTHVRNLVDGTTAQDA